jgi:hypothetical protein
MAFYARYSLVPGPATVWGFFYNHTVPIPSLYSADAAVLGLALSISLTG